MARCSLRARTNEEIPLATKPCQYCDDCRFFNGEVGYSPDLFETMREHYCLSAMDDCARFLAIQLVGRHNVPATLLPTDREQINSLPAQ